MQVDTAVGRRRRELVLGGQNSTLIPGEKWTPYCAKYLLTFAWLWGLVSSGWNPWQSWYKIEIFPSPTWLNSCLCH